MNRFLLLAMFLISSVRGEIVTVLEPSEKMPEKKTVVWSPLFQAMWDEMNLNLGGKPSKIEPPNELMTRLDDFEWESEKVMPVGSWKVWAGKADEGFLKKVNAEAAELTGEKDGPFEMGDWSPGTLACFGLLDREVEFEKELYESKKAPLAFRFEKEVSNISFFGVRGRLAENYGRSIRVLAYSNKSHAVEISCNEVDDKVVLYLPAEGEDFKTACEQIKKMREDPVVSMLHDGDDLRIPYVSLSVTSDLVSQLVGTRFYGGDANPWRIARAEQKTDFELFEKGAKVRVETSMNVEPFGSVPQPLPPRKLVYDRPFFIFLCRDGAELPYLGVWVGDDSALKKFEAGK